MQESELQTHLEAITEDGFEILENVFSLERADALCRRASEIERDSFDASVSTSITEAINSPIQDSDNAGAAGMNEKKK
jgi:hypothetical protein